MSNDENRKITVEKSEYRVLPPIRVVIQNNPNDQSSLHLTRKEAAELIEKLASYLAK